MNYNDITSFLIHQKNNLHLADYKVILYHLDSYKEVKSFTDLVVKLELNPPFSFRGESLALFTEDYEDLIKLKSSILRFTNRKRKYPRLFKQQIMLSKTRDSAINIIKEAITFGVMLDMDKWSANYNSLSQIKKEQEVWKEQLRSNDFFNQSIARFENFFESRAKELSLNDLKEKLLSTYISYNITDPNSSIARKSYVREFARKSAEGICQLCDKKAPFSDKSGRPFLEVHHIHHLSKGGSDTIQNVIALCPNCHREIHHRDSKEKVDKITKRALHLSAQQ